MALCCIRHIKRKWEKSVEMQYKIKAARHGEGMVYVDIDAKSKDDAIRQASERGFTVLSVRSNEAFIKLPKLYFSRFVKTDLSSQFNVISELKI